MLHHFVRCGLLLIAALIISPLRADDAKVRVITLGDSITRGVRQGVKADEVYGALLQGGLRERKIDAEVINVGIGGERTDQALKRLAREVIAKKPALVTIMYGTNDSYLDKDKPAPRLTVAEYEANLRQLVKELRDAGVQPVLMTPPRWGDKARNWKGDNPNVLLEDYVKACRKVAQDTKTPLVDHYEYWLRKEKDGVKIGDWTTDQCHPNPQGHRELTGIILPVVVEALKKK